MANTMFGSPEELLGFVITPLPLTKSQSQSLFDDFTAGGYIARQENTGLSIIPKMMGARGYTDLAQGDPRAPSFVQVVMLSNPELTDEEFDSWVDVVHNWVDGLPPATRSAWSKEIRLQKRVEHGIPLNFLHKDMPANLLISYRRKGDFAIVVDPPAAGRRKIYTAKNIG